VKIKVEKLKPTGKVLKVPEELRWYPNDPNRGIGKRVVFLHARPYREEEAMKFKTDSDRRAWRAYAREALAGLLPWELENNQGLNSSGELAAVVARLADAMLDEERKRRRAVAPRC
jgi:hypothetical protein